MERRKTFGYTQESFAEKIGVSKNHISTIERGGCIPTTKLLFRICNELGGTPDYYLIGSTTEQTDHITKLVNSIPPDKQKFLYKLLETYVECSHSI